MGTVYRGIQRFIATRTKTIIRMKVLLTITMFAALAMVVYSEKPPSNYKCTGETKKYEWHTEDKSCKKYYSCDGGKMNTRFVRPGTCPGDQCFDKTKGECVKGECDKTKGECVSKEKKEDDKTKDDKTKDDKTKDDKTKDGKTKDDKTKDDKTKDDKPKDDKTKDDKTK